MQFIIFILGVILGVLIRDIKFEISKKFKQVHDLIVPQGKVQFIEPIPFKEKFQNSKSINDLLNE